MTRSPNLPITKQHFDTLDGLRGVASLSVVVFHFMEWVYSDYSQNFIGHGYLAVDFFFCLSGFVIAYAYDDRIKRIGIFEFLKLRLIRLHPLVILGSVLGLLGYLFDPFSAQPLYGTGRLLLVFLCSVFLIPFPVMEDRVFNLFGLNAPSWSLFWEYIANILYALILYKINRRYLMFLLIAAGIVLCYIGIRSGNLMGGWGKANVWDGAARVSYSFLAGLLIHRCKFTIRNRFGFVTLAVLLVIPFVMPWTGWNAGAESLAVLFYFPLIVALGAGTKPGAGFYDLCLFSGKISYPLYMTHYAGIWIFANYYTLEKPEGTKLAIIITTATIVLVGVAYLIMRIYDTPIRKYLTSRRIKFKDLV